MMRTAVATALLVALVGCGSGSEPVPPAGVDGLVVPTPSPDPADFVRRVDNPWLAVDRGPATYRTAEGTTVPRRVGPGPRVGGVATTSVTLGAETDLYAQDRRGNVWWFGREGEWRAGVDGALAGLVMAAKPRVGDGYERAEVPGADLRAEVVDVGPDQVVLELVTDGEVSEATYERGVGLVRLETAEGVVELELDDTF